MRFLLGEREQRRDREALSVLFRATRGWFEFWRKGSSAMPPKRMLLVPEVFSLLLFARPVFFQSRTAALLGLGSPKWRTTWLSTAPLASRPDTSIRTRAAGGRAAGRGAGSVDTVPTRHDRSLPCKARRLRRIDERSRKCSAA